MTAEIPLSGNVLPLKQREPVLSVQLAQSAQSILSQMGSRVPLFMLLDYDLTPDDTRTKTRLPECDQLLLQQWSSFLGNPDMVSDVQKPTLKRCLITAMKRGPTTVGDLRSAVREGVSFGPVDTPFLSTAFQTPEVDARVPFM